MHACVTSVVPFMLGSSLLLAWPFPFMLGINLLLAWPLPFMLGINLLLAWPLPFMLGINLLLAWPLPFMLGISLHASGRWFHVSRSSILCHDSELLVRVHVYDQGVSLWCTICTGLGVAVTGETVIAKITRSLFSIVHQNLGLCFDHSVIRFELWKSVPLVFVRVNCVQVSVQEHRFLLVRNSRFGCTRCPFACFAMELLPALVRLQRVLELLVHGEYVV